jgi:cytosine/adenosine deaminase-related metal-dependent hydrolase
LQSATSSRARFLASNAGTIERGKIPDLILHDANPLNDPANVFRQSGVMLHGRWFAEDALQDQLHSLHWQTMRRGISHFRSRVGRIVRGVQSFPYE